MKRYIVVGSIVALVVAPSICRAATAYRFSSKSTGALAIEISGEVLEDPSASRVAIRKGDGMFLEDGDVILFRHASRHIHVLKPSKKEFYQVTAKELFEFTSGLAGAMRGFIAVEFGRPTTSARSFATPSIEGRKTRGLEIISDSDLRVKISGLAQKAKLRSVSRWITTDSVSGTPSPFLREQTLRTGIRELDEQLAGELRLVKGFPLRQTRRITTKIGRRSQSFETITEIGGVRTDVSTRADSFVVPAGFKRIEPPLARVRRLLGQ